MTGPAWVIGGNGLLGSALRRRLTDAGRRTFIRAMPWTSPATVRSELAVGIDEWLDSCSEEEGALELYWAAGATVMSSSSQAAQAEFSVFDDFLTDLVEKAKKRGVESRLVVFLASSVGGVYSGGGSAPFDEFSPTRPNSPYGERKIAMEAILSAAVERSAARAVIGRISTLYGPGQRIDKPQGFISHLCRSHVLRIAMSVYVPLDTMRDYVHTDDAAQVIIASMSLARETAGGTATIKNVAGHAPSTIGTVLHEASLIFKRRPLVILAASPASANQVRDLRVDSHVWPELQRIPRRSLAVGLAETRLGLELAFRQHRLDPTP